MLRRSFRPALEHLEQRSVPTASPVTLQGGVLSVVPAATGETDIDFERSGNKIQVFYGSAEYDVAAQRVSAVLVDGSHAGVGSTIDVLQDTALPTEMIGGAGTNNFIAGSGTTILLAGSGTNNFIGGNGATLFIASTNGTNSFLAGNGYNEIELLAGNSSVVGGAGLNVYFLTGGTNSIELGTGYSLVFDLGGDNTISSASNSQGLILDLDTNVAGSISVDAGVEVIDPVGC